MTELSGHQCVTHRRSETLSRITKEELLSGRNYLQNRLRRSIRGRDDAITDSGNRAAIRGSLERQCVVKRSQSVGLETRNDVEEEVLPATNLRRLNFLKFGDARLQRLRRRYDGMSGGARGRSDGRRRIDERLVGRLRLFKGLKEAGILLRGTEGAGRSTTPTLCGLDSRRAKRRFDRDPP